MLTISTTHYPASDLGYLLQKNPARVQEFSLSSGKAIVFYPEANDNRCTFCLLLVFDPVELSRGRGDSGTSFALQPYVNDRLYTASSYMSVAISRVLGSALKGQSKERPELANTEIPLKASLSVISGSPEMAARLFEPLGYEVEAERLPLEPENPEWGGSPYIRLTLNKTCRLSELLGHLYVLIPVLDKQKHYWFEKDEIEKLLRHGESWLESHPEKNLVTSRYFLWRQGLISETLVRIAGNKEDMTPTDENSEESPPETIERKQRLHDVRLQAAAAALKASGAQSVADLGCGEGKLISLLLKETSFTRILGMDISVYVLRTAARRLHLDQDTPTSRRVTLIQGSLVYSDSRLQGYDAAALVEVIEHLEPERLPAFEKAILGFAGPKTLVVTTPNREYNARFENPLPLRHLDHRFEWTGEEFRQWAERVAAEYGYTVTLQPVGEVVENFGAPSQMAVFTK